FVTHHATPAVLLVFSLRPSPPPLSTLFPYTTLFRSPIGLSLVNKLAPARFASLLMGTWFLANASANKFAGTLSSLYPEKGQTTQDRKSTCLNSSHVEISYAVFCLKKKKRTATQQQLT